MSFPWNIGSFISSISILYHLPADATLLLDAAWHVGHVDTYCVYFLNGGVMHEGLDMLLLGFDLASTLSVSWVCLSSLSL